MKYFMAFICLLWWGNACAQDWDSYMAKFGNKPGSVLVDMSLMANAPDKRYPYLLITGPKARNCNENGIPERQEMSDMEDILSATGNFITGVTAKVLAGTFTYNCQRLNYYYIKDTAGIRNAILRLYDRSYRDHYYAVNMKYDPDWSTYKTFLYPNEEMQNWMQNTKIITNMLKEGDSLSAMHNINFELFFTTDTGRTAFTTYATTHGYSIGRQNQTKKPPISYGLLIIKKSKVDIDEMNKATSELAEEAKKHGGNYAGWYATKLAD